MQKLLFFFLLSFLFFSCRKEATSWYSGWTVPMFNDTLDLENLTNDSTLAIQNGFYVLDLKRKIASIKPSEFVKIPDTIIEQKFAISISALNISPGTSFVNNNKDHIFDLDDVEIKKARVKKGKIYLEVFNEVATKTFFEIELPSVTLDNLKIKEKLELPAGTQQNPSSNILEIDLSGYFIDMTGSNGNSFNSLPSKLKVTTDPNGSSVTLTSSDSTKFKIRMEGIELDYARGYFGNYKLSDSYSIESKFLKENLSGTIDLPNVHLDLSFENGIKTSAKANLKKLNNINSLNATNVLLTNDLIGNPFTVQTATGSWENLVPSNKTFVFDETNSNLENFMENLGEKTEIDFDLELNPWGNISNGWDEFFPNSALDVNLSMQMPLQIGLNNLILKEVFTVSFEQDFEKTHIESGELHLKIENAFPFDGVLSLSFHDKLGEKLFSIDDIQKIQSSVYGNLNTFGILSSKSNLDIPFPLEYIEKLTQVANIQASIKLNSPNEITNVNEQVLIPEKAFLKLKLQTSFKLNNKIGE
ncbi:MAG: hypothetical protein V4622_12365 [Bacteroidota bacterium]